MLAFELAQRFRKTRSEQRFISFISMSSTIGIALGCFVLIVLLSVMNGFEKELQKSSFSLFDFRFINIIWTEHVFFVNAVLQIIHQCVFTLT